jgi:hypothetical protein
VGPLKKRKVAGYGWPGRSAKAAPACRDEGSNPLPSARERCERLDGETDDHSLLLTRLGVFGRRGGSNPGRGILRDKTIYGVRGVAVSARLAVNQKVAVQLRSDTHLMLIAGWGVVATRLVN